jgi:hypothetical protein
MNNNFNFNLSIFEHKIISKNYIILDNSIIDDLLLLSYDSFNIINESAYYYINYIYICPVKLKISHQITYLSIKFLKKLNFSNLMYIEINNVKSTKLLQKKFTNKLFYLKYNLSNNNYNSSFNYLQNSIKIIKNNNNNNNNNNNKIYISYPNKLQYYDTDIFYNRKYFKKLPIKCKLIINNNIIVIKNKYNKIKINDVKIIII